MAQGDRKFMACYNRALVAHDRLKQELNSKAVIEEHVSASGQAQLSIGEASLGPLVAVTLLFVLTFWLC